MSRPAAARSRLRRPRRLLRRMWSVLLVILVGVPLFWLFSLTLLRWVDPPFTGVQAQRRVESWFARGPYQKRYTPVPLDRISPHLQHAVIAAEDGRFYRHHGIDWTELFLLAAKSPNPLDPKRGASTLTQQLVKNLYFTTHRNPVRKLCEFGLAPLSELLLSKDRILELYLNSVEWGPGVFGAEAASQYYYHRPARSLDRDQAARLAACLPAPRKRRPALMNQYGAIIEERMRLMGW